MRHVTAILLFVCMHTLVHAEICDTRLQPVLTPKELAYQNRGDRCEGIYQQPVSTTGLRIVSFQANHMPDTGDNGITISTTAPGPKKLTIESTGRRQYYRLDKTFEGNDYFYSFEIIDNELIRIDRKTIAAKLCLSDCHGLWPVLVPVVYGSGEMATYLPFITLQAMEGLTMMHVEIRAADDDRVLFNKNLLESANWPAWRPAQIPLTSFFSQAPELILRVTARGHARTQTDAISAILRAGSPEDGTQTP